MSEFTFHICAIIVAMLLGFTFVMISSGDPETNRPATLPTGVQRSQYYGGNDLMSESFHSWGYKPTQDKLATVLRWVDNSTDLSGEKRLDAANRLVLCIDSLRSDTRLKVSDVMQKCGNITGVTK